MRAIRKMQRVILALFILTLLAFCGLRIYRRLTVDVTPPVITCSTDSIDVSVTAGDEALLQGVMASDDRDGDLTDQILIKGVSPSLTDSSAQVTYIVFDSANNMATVTRTVRYTDYEAPRFALSQPLVYPAGQTVTLLDRLTASDVLDGDISSGIRITSQNVINSQPGVYSVTAQVDSRLGNSVVLPLKVVITNYEEGKTELFTAINNPEDESAGTRQVPFSKVIYIERDDFMEEPPKKFFRLAPGGEVRLRYSYLIRCEEVIKDAAGNITELRCTYDPMSGGGSSSDGRRVKGVIHWVSAKDAVEAEIRLFNPLFTKENPDDVEEGQTWEDNLNPESMVKVTGYLEPSLRDIPIGQAVQFERVGYFCPDTDSTPEHPVFNRTVTLKDSWAKINK